MEHDLILRPDGKAYFCRSCLRLWLSMPPDPEAVCPSTPPQSRPEDFNRNLQELAKCAGAESEGL